MSRRATFHVSHPAQTVYRVLGPTTPEARAAARRAWEKVTMRDWERARHNLDHDRRVVGCVWCP